MKKIIFIFISFLLMNIFVIADESIIIDIEINGLERIEKSTVLLYSELDVNNKYSNEIGNKSLKKY